MDSQIKLGRIFGINIGLHYTWVIIALLIVLSLAARFQAMHPNRGPGVAWVTAIITGALFFAAIIAHELSHALGAKWRGLPVHAITLSLIGSRALAVYGDVGGSAAANNHPGSRRCTARLLRRSDASASARGCARTRSVQRAGAGSVG